MTSKMEWKEFATTATDFAENGDVDEHDGMSIHKMIEKGNATPKRQRAITSAIREILRDYDGSPFGSRSPLTPAGQATVAAAVAAIAAMATIFDEGGDTLRGLLVPHGRSKNADGTKQTAYANGADLVETLETQINTKAVALTKTTDWDGTSDGLTAILGGSA